MSRRWIAAVGILVLTGAPAFAHRLDEYLQATMISIERDHVEAVMRLQPGVAAYPDIIANIDTDNDGAISSAEQRRYAEQVLREISLQIDGKPISPQIVSVMFP